jgi:hypothetical protein
MIPCWKEMSTGLYPLMTCLAQPVWDLMGKERDFLDGILTTYLHMYMNMYLAISRANIQR